MRIEDRDDMQLYEHTAPNGIVYQFRMIDSNMEPDGKGGFYCRFPVFEKGTTELLFIATFRVKSDEIDSTLFKTYDAIDEFVNNKK